MNSSRVSNSHLVVVAVAELGGANRFVHPEDVALRADKLAPGKFRWKKFRDYIDVNIVKKALRDTKRKHGHTSPLLVGDNTKGWMLTPAGQEWYGQTGAALLSNAQQTEVNRKSSVEAEQEAERIRMRKTVAFKLYKSGKQDEISLTDFRRFARINEYFLSKARTRRFALVDNVVSSDRELAKLWRILKVAFAEEMH